MPNVLLACIARAVAANAAGPLARYAPLGEAIWNVAEHAMDEWKKRQPDPMRRREGLEGVARLADYDAWLMAETGGCGRQLNSYISSIPATVRRSFVRRDDPEGSTAPPDLPLDEGRHLLPFLSLRAPRFVRGERLLLGGGIDLVELLGVGGFGEVWKAKYVSHPSMSHGGAMLEDFVALKFCLEEDAIRVLRHEQGVLDQVLKEGDNEGIVKLRRTYLDADPPCLEYEYIEGETLGRQMRAWPESSPGDDRALRLMRALTGIVAAAHRLDPPVVHRDLKPANILVQQTTGGKQTPGGARLRITDFGIGGLATRQARQQTTTRRAHEVYMLSRLWGAYTPLYASPEQVKGEPPDPRDDVHALGVIWYQLLLGDPCAKPTPDWNLILQQRGVCAEAIGVVGRCLASAKRRWPNAVRLAEEVERLARVGEAPPKSSRLGPGVLHPTILMRCPRCASQLGIPGELIGEKVRCSACQWIFAAVAPNAPVPVSTPAPPRSQVDEVPSESVRRAPWRDMNLDQGAPLAKLTPAPAPAPKIASPPLAVLVGADRPTRGHSEPTQRTPERRGGSTVQVLGLLSMACLLLLFIPILPSLIGVILGGVGWFMGYVELQRMSRHAMSPSGGGTIKAGYHCSILGTLLNGLWLLTCGGCIGWMQYNDIQRRPAERAQNEVDQAGAWIAGEAEKQRQDQNQVKRCADAFVRELKDKRVAAAYQMTTAGYQLRVSKEQFTALVEQKHREINAILMWGTSYAPDSGNTYRCSYTVSMIGPTHRCNVVMVTDGAVWKVDQFTFGSGY
jgi:hypothetical protein